MSAATPRRILIVDDSAEDRAIIRRMLRDTGFVSSVAECETGAEGLKQIRSERPDCVLLDFRLPDMEALDFLETFADGLPCPVAVLTGLDDTQAASAALSRGAQDYIVKGTLTAHGLGRVIENAVEKFAILRELNDKRAILELRNRQLESIREQLESNLADLVDATRAKDRFMAVMSHEMRTPLNAVLGYADLLEIGLGGELNQSQRDYVERIRVGSRHLLDLINDVLDLTRADARRIELDLRPVDAVAVAEEVVSLLENQARAKNLSLVLEPCADAVPLVMADLQRLRQILTNLVGNAIKFTDHGEVRVACNVADGRVEVRVADTGIGIDRDAVPMIFTEFFQADGDLTRRQGGSGLGLAISQRLARLMRGDILVESESGKGSTFSLVLPQAEHGSRRRPEDVDSHEARMVAHRTAQLGREQKTRDRVVVVAYGDNPDSLRELSQRVLHDVRLVWTTQVDEVPTLAHRENASLVVLDIACEKGAGWHAAHALRENAELASIAVLLLPCIPMPITEELASGLDLGWVTLVPKPFTHEQLTRAVETAARGGGDDDDEIRGGTVEVLIVDDDEDSRRVATKFLETGSVVVREVADGETALIEMRRRPPHVVVLDLMMPVLDGFGVLAAMRADPFLARVPVVVLSAKSLSEAERQFLARSAVRVLQKGEHRLSDVAALVLRAAAGVPPAPLV